MSQSQTAEDKMTDGEMTNIKMRFDRQKILQSDKETRCISIVIKPLRIFQFLVVLLVFAFTIHMIVLSPTPISQIACILLIILSGVYVFVCAIEMISYFAGSALHIIPTSIFSFLGFLLFGAAGILLICKNYVYLAVQIVVVTSCFLAALLFLIDITILLAFFKRRCSICKRCCNHDGTEFLPRTKAESLPVTATIARTMRQDVTTSLSDLRIPRVSEEAGTALPEHCYRRVEYPRRRQYVDCPTCVPSLCNLDVAQIQTEPHKVSVVESQTPSTIVKETPIQTLSKCELCQQILFAPSAIETASPDGGPCFQHPSRLAYPAIVQIVRGSVPCCSGCKCTATTTPQPQPQPQPQQQKRQPSSLKRAESLARTRESSQSRMLTSETTQQVTNSVSGKLLDDVTKKLKREMTPSVTKVTIASPNIKPEKRIKTSLDTALKRDASVIGIKEDAKATNGCVNSIIATRDEEPETIVPSIDERGEKDRMTSIAEREESNEQNENNDKIERSKGGGEDRTTIYRQFMHATQLRDTRNIGESHTVATQVNVTTLLGKTKIRPLLQLRLNKIDPIENTKCDKESISEIASKQINQANQRDERNESSSPIDQTDCSFCRRRISTPSSDNCRNYAIFKDKGEKYFCEFCAPLNSKKITCRLESTDMKKLRCANCRFTLRERRVQTNVKLKDICPKCGQSQRYATFPSST